MYLTCQLGYRGESLETTADLMKTVPSVYHLLTYFVNIGGGGEGHSETTAGFMKTVPSVYTLLSMYLTCQLGYRGRVIWKL